MFQRSSLMSNWILFSVITLFSFMYLQTQAAGGNQEAVDAFKEEEKNRCTLHYDENVNVSWPWKCNTCSCISRGIAGCTLQLCPPDDLLHNLNLPESLSRSVALADDAWEAHCQPGKGPQSFNIDCNLCHCNESPSTLVCSRMLCPPPEPEERKVTQKAERDCSKDIHSSHR